MLIRERSVNLLGQYRAVESIEILIRHIEEIQPSVIFGKNIYTIYPCVPALVRIGKPASTIALKELRKPMKDIRRMALAAVIAGVEGRKIGRFMIQMELAKPSSPAEKRNLQAAMKTFLALTANERTTEELKAEEHGKKR